MEITQRRQKIRPKVRFPLVLAMRINLAMTLCSDDTSWKRSDFFLNRPINGDGWMLLLERPNQEALLQEFKGLCGIEPVDQKLARHRGKSLSTDSKSLLSYLLTFNFLGQNQILFLCYASCITNISHQKTNVSIKLKVCIVWHDPVSSSRGSSKYMCF